MHPPGHSLHVSSCKIPHTWFIYYHVVELLVQPTQDIVVCQPISHPRRVCFVRDGTSSTPFRSWRCDKGRTWRSLLSLRLLPWHRGHNRRCKGVQLPIHIPNWTRAVPNASKRWTKSVVAHKWADWLHNPLLVGGSPTLPSGGHNQKVPNASGVGDKIRSVPNTSERGTKICSGPQVGRLPT